MIDANQNLDINKMVKSVEDGEWGTFPDQWLKENHIKDCRNCATYADSIPKSVFAECAYVKNGEGLCFSSNVRRKPSTSVA